MQRHTCETLQQALPSLLSIYLFGSQADATANSQSDVDLAVLVEGYAGTEQLWELASILAEQIDCQIDLLDLRAASTVMQYQVVTKGQRLWHRDVRAGVYEAFVLSEKTALDEARRGLLDDIGKSGHVYPR